jgi:hypothetical protein
MNFDEYYEKKLTEFEQDTNDGNLCSNIRTGLPSKLTIWLMQELYKWEVMAVEAKQLPPVELK